MAGWSAKRLKIKNEAKLVLSKNIQVCMYAAVAVLLLQGLMLFIQNYFAPSITVNYTAETFEDLIDSVKITNKMVAIVFLLRFTSVLVNAPAEMGAREIFVNLTRDKTLDLKQILKWYTEKEKTVKAVVISLLITVLTLLWQALFVVVPGIAVITMSLWGTAYYSESFTLLVINVFSIVMVLGAAFSFVFSWAYIPAKYILAYESKNKITAALRESVKLLKGHKWEYFVFRLSFLPSLILSVLTFGLGFSYTIPYMQISTQLFIDGLKPAEASVPDKGDI